MSDSGAERPRRPLFMAPSAAPDLDRALLDVHHDAVIPKPADTSAASFGRPRSLAAARYLVQRNQEAASGIDAALNALRSDVGRVATAFPAILDHFTDIADADARSIRELGAR
jgi:hypothetical protein